MGCAIACSTLFIARGALLASRPVCHRAMLFRNISASQAGRYACIKRINRMLASSMQRTYACQ